MGVIPVAAETEVWRGGFPRMEGGVGRRGAVCPMVTVGGGLAMATAGAARDMAFSSSGKVSVGRAEPSRLVVWCALIRK